jgi:hypothetical protein
MIRVWYSGKTVATVDTDATPSEVADLVYHKLGDCDVWTDPDGWVVEPIWKHPMASILHPAHERS